MAIVLAACFGLFGLHLFYLGDKPRGKKYLAFCWTFVPVFLGFRDAVKLVLMERTQFETTYGSRE
jgi:TM2 domain-containing membrane protein YozV